MTDYKLTVIIPTYNAKSYITRCLDCLINQTYKDFCVIIIDDASNDGTAEIIKKKIFNQNNMKYIVLTENHGPSYCRNIGINMTNTPYITFIDSDDYIDIFTYSECMQENIQNCNVIIYGLSYDYMKTDIIEKKYVYPQKFSVTGQYALKVYGHTIHDSFKITPIVNNKIYNTAWLKNNFISFDERVRHQEDDIFTFKVLSQAETVLFVPNCFYHYCQNSSSIIHTIEEETVTHFVMAYKSLYDYLTKKGTFIEYEDEFYLKFKSSLKGVIKRTIDYSNDISKSMNLLSILYTQILENFEIEKLLHYFDFNNL